MNDPKAESDQLAAARRHASKVLEDLDLGPGQEERQIGDVVGGIVTRFIEAVDNPDLGRMCPHVIDSPGVVYGLGCMPGVLTCRPCMQMVSSLQAMQQMMSGGRKCDGCGDVLANEVTQGVSQIGPALIEITLCTFCAQMDCISVENDERD